jgi:hypothetical protein
LNAEQRKRAPSFWFLDLGNIALVLSSRCSETKYKIAEWEAGVVAVGGANLAGTKGDGRWEHAADQH